MRLQGGIFDIDGVLLDTPHEKAWRQALDDLMTGAWRDLAPRTTYAADAFTDAVYQEQVAGKPREDGAAAALAYFHVPDDDGARAREYGDAKQAVLEKLAAAGDVRAYDDAVWFLLEVKAAGVRVCAASSSKNADGFLRAVSVEPFTRGKQYPFVNAHTTLLDLFDADVDGQPMPHGKPDPALFLSAARALDFDPSVCFVVEDAPAGVEAARAGGMYAIGVARHQDDASLHAQHADLVTEKLDTLDIAALIERRSGGAAS